MRLSTKLLYLLSCLIVLSCTKENQPVTKLEMLLPKVEGWKLAEKPRFYTHENLFDYINGNCELYFSYGFRGLVSAVYSNSSDPEKTVTVDIYDMGTPISAFGIYSSMSHSDLSYGVIGCEAIISPLQVRFWQDRYEVEINSGTTKENPEKMVRNMAKNVSLNLPNCQTLLELTWLPERNLVPHSLKYVADGFLGHGFIPGGLEATYTIQNQEIRGFLAKCDNDDQARHCLNQYRQSQRSFNGVEIKDLGNHFEAYHNYTGYVWAGYKGSWFFGAISQTDIDLSRKVAEIIAENLQVSEKN